MPEALSAMQKLQKLKELQMKRDISERYYTQEIKRLIGEYYFGPKIASPSVRSAGRLQSSSFHPSSADRLKHVSNIYIFYLKYFAIKYSIVRFLYIYIYIKKVFWLKTKENLLT